MKKKKKERKEFLERRPRHCLPKNYQLSQESLLKFSVIWPLIKKYDVIFSGCVEPHIGFGIKLVTQDTSVLPV